MIINVLEISVLKFKKKERGKGGQRCKEEQKAPEASHGLNKNALNKLQLLVEASSCSNTKKNSDC